MSQPRSRAAVWSHRGLTLLLPFLLTGLVLAQNPKGKSAGDEEVKPKAKKKIDDDEEVKPKAKKKIDEDDSPSPKTDVARPSGKAVRTVGEEKVDLASLAEKAPTEELKLLYRQLMYPHDRLYQRSTGWVNTVPVDVYIGERPNEVRVPYTPMLPGGKPEKLSTSAAAGELLQAKHYEQIAIDAVKEFLAKGLTSKPGERNYLSRLEQLTAGDKILTATAQFNESQRSAGKRKGGGWDALRQTLRAETLNVLGEELSELDKLSATDKPAALRAADLAARIADDYPDTLTAQILVAVWKLNQAGNELHQRDEAYIQGAQTLHALQQKFAGADAQAFEALRDRLKRRAQAHHDEAKRLAAEPDGKFQARNQIEMAELIYADLEGLPETKTQLYRDYRLLIVGVPELPERISPALAVTDADRWAGELIFESLIKPVPDPTVGQRYWTELAALPPRLVSMGREFLLVKDALWVSKDGPGEPVTAYDVKKTIEMMQEHKGLQVSEGVDVLQAPTVQDRLLFRLNLDRGSLEPLSAMSFKILPTHILEKRPKNLLDPEFAASPVGSGPYVYHGRRKEDGREYAVFKANPAFGKRAGKFGLPRIQEIRFLATPASAPADLRDGKIDLVLGVPTEQLPNFRTPELARRISDVTLRSQRIWMLAVNHRKPELGQEAGTFLRRALAHAIDREEIVRAFKAGTLYHRPLTGPFPPDTWATPTSPPPGPLYRPERAQAMAKQAKAPAQLSLKCGNDAQSRVACEMIKQQIERIGLGIRIEVVPLSTDTLHQAVYMTHDFELAYLPYDYNEVYSLNGLLDPEAMGPGERNFLGYTPEQGLSRLLSQIRGTRNFNEASRWMKLLFNEFNNQMPFIPLWQLDFHAVVSQNLQTVPLASQLDPRTIFDQVEEWRLNR
jgi:ABC-type transport system substrate-binding protein